MSGNGLDGSPNLMPGSSLGAGNAGVGVGAGVGIGMIGAGSGGLKRPSENQTEVLDKKRLQELVKEVDPHEQLDEDVEELLLHIADDFIEQTVVASCALAKHRRSTNVDVRDVQLVLEKNFNMWIPGIGGSAGAEDTAVRQLGKRATSDAHKARMALIRKQLKKY